MADRAIIEEFLAHRRLALVGASRNPKAFSTAVYRELKAKGYDLVPVNPEADEIEGDPCVGQVADLPEDIEGAIVMVPAPRAAEVVQACIDKGIERVWLHKGVGPDSVSDEAVALGRAHGIAMVDGACPLMYAEPVGWFHRLHRAELRLTGRAPVASAS